MFGRKPPSSKDQVKSGPIQLPAVTDAAADEEQETQDGYANPAELAREIIRDQLFKTIDPGAALRMKPERLRGEVSARVAEIASAERLQLNEQEQMAIAHDLLDDMIGVGPIEPLLNDPTVTDILVNGPNKIFAERAGRLELTGLKFRDEAHVINVAQRIAASVGRRVDESSPMVDARLADGSRVNVIVPAFGN